MTGSSGDGSDCQTDDGRRIMMQGRLFTLTVAATVALGCDRAATSPGTSNLEPRTFRMGFSAIPPDSTQRSTFASLNAWTTRADAAIMHISVPYKALLTGTSASTYVSTVDLPLANFYRAKNLMVVITVDVTNGLDRSAEAPDLVAMNRSITEPAVQQVYRQYVQALVSQIHPTYLGLAAETNLIRATAPAAVYTALVQMANAAAADVRAMPGPLPRLYVSVQADYAWGKIIKKCYQGVGA